MRCDVLTLGWLFVLMVPLTLGEEIRRRDGTKAVGELTWVDGRFRLIVQGKSEPLADVDVLKRAGNPWPTRECGWVVHIVGGDSFPVQVQSLSEQELTGLTPWAEQVRVPRSAIDQINFGSGRALLLADWKTLSASNEPMVETERVTFHKADQSLRWSVPEFTHGELILRAPWVQTKSRRLTMELEFVFDGNPSVIAVDLAAPEKRINVSSVHMADVVGKINRDGNSHRLAVLIQPDQVQLLIDGYVLWSRDQSLGVLKEVRWKTQGAGDEAVSLEQITAWKRVATEKPVLSVRPRKDRLITQDGTEIFGLFTQMDSQGPTMLVRGKRFSLSWAAVRECSFSESLGLEKPTVGSHAELTLAMRNLPKARLTGRVNQWTPEHIELEHPRLGMLKLPQTMVTEIRPLFEGRRQPIFPGALHLGQREVVGFWNAKPDGASVQHEVPMAEIPTHAVLVVDGKTNQGVAVLVIELNGQKVGQFRFSDRELTTQRIPVLTGWRQGRNELIWRIDSSTSTGDLELRHARWEILDSKK